MWIWISVGILCWLICFVLVQKIMRNIHANKWSSLTWDSGDTGTAIFLGVLGIIAVPMIFLIAGKHCFKKSTKIYWDEKQQQIKTKGGKCLWDKSQHWGKFEKLKAMIDDFDKRLKAEESIEGCDGICETKIDKCNEAIKAIERSLTSTSDYTTIKAQLQCGAKHHDKWEFVIRTGIHVGVDSPAGSSHCLARIRFIFKCSDCGLEITKIAKELTATEREALRKLKLL